MSPRFNCVLLVDDDSITNFINHRLVKRMNITENIEFAVNGSDAIEFIEIFARQNKNLCPELILLDINMPVLDGFEFLERFKEMNFSNSASIKIIVLTTSSHNHDIIKISQNQNVGYINKPLTQEKLETVLNNHNPDLRVKEAY